MSQDQRLPAEQERFVELLSGLRPAGAGIDRDRLMFLAGQRSMRSRCRAWQGLGGLLAVMLAATVALQWVAQPARHAPIVAAVPAPQIVELAAIPPAAADAEDFPRQAAYLKLRRQVLDDGLDALPKAEFASAEPVRLRSEELLLERPSPTQTSTHSVLFNLGRLFGLGDGT